MHGDPVETTFGAVEREQAVGSGWQDYLGSRKLS